MRFGLSLSLLIFLLVPQGAWSWNGVDHRMVPRVALRSLNTVGGLDQAVPYEPLTEFIKKLSTVFPQVQTESDFYRWLITNPNISFDKNEESMALGTLVDPLDILSHSSAAPDDGRDQNLFEISDKDKRGRVTRQMLWFGSLAGIGSQAFRHIEKPAFSLKYPLETFGFPPTTLGEATKRAKIYFLLSLVADRLESPYWAWRFLGCSFHYIQDLHNPHHATQIAPRLLWKGLLAYLGWGLKQDKGLLKTIGHIGSNVHQFFETWVAEHTGPNYAKYLQGDPLGVPLNTRLLLRSLEGESTLAIDDLRTLVLETRNMSNRQSVKLTHIVLDLTGDHLLGPKEFINNDSEQSETHGFISLAALKDLDPYETPLWPLLRDRFQAMGEALRQTVLFFVQEQKKQADIQVLLNRLRDLLSEE